MKAWRMYGIGDMRLDDVPIPATKAGWVLTKVKMLQPSVTEVQQFMGYDVRSLNLINQLKEKGPLQKFGHEFCASIVELGGDVNNFKAGDRVFYWRRAPCGNCPACLKGYQEICSRGISVGTNIPGSLAEYVLLPASSLAVIPDSITDSEATAMQPLMSVAETVFSTGIDIGDTVVILGQGSMGLNVTQLSRLCGSGKIIAVDVRNEALSFSSDFGADLLINANEKDPVEAVLEATQGLGADIVFECAGGSTKHGLAGLTALSQAIKMVREHGKITQIAYLGPDANIDVSLIIQRGIQYLGLGVGSYKLVSYITELVANKHIKLEPLITHILKGLDKVPESFEITGNKSKYGAINPAQVIVSE